MKTALLIIIYILLGAVTFVATKGEKYYSILYGLLWPLTWIVELGFLSILLWDSMKKTVLDALYGKEVYYYNPNLLGGNGKEYMATVYRCRPGRKPVVDCSYSDKSYTWVLLATRAYVYACNKSETK